MRKLQERAQALLETIRTHIVKRSEKLTAEFVKTDYKKDNVLPDRASMRPLPDGMWAEHDGEHGWFRLAVTLPECGEGERIGLFAELAEGWIAESPQYLVYADGEIVCGADKNHTEICFDRAGEHEVFFYAYSGKVYDYGIKTVFSLKTIDVNTEKLYYDLLAPMQVLHYTEPESAAYSDVLSHVNAALNLLDLREFYSENYERTACAASAYLRENLYGGTDKKPAVAGIGHTHIDIAWLWPYRLTREKAVHSFATVLYLMDRYPEYKFMSSQAILYQIVKEDAPELYEKIKARVKEGRWEVEGAMWLEADCNLISGESFVRQILFGKKFFKEEFGVNSKILWLPDVFGYSAAMPQILRKSGVETFVTSKISWNDTNKMPFDTFYWYGIDGSKVFTYFLTPQDKERGRKPVVYTTYTGNTNAEQIAGTWERYQQKELNDEALLTFGYGDGGGGPTADMLEKMRRANMGLPNLPAAKICRAGDFIERLKENCAGKKVPEIRGELYLEFHRGTYTNIAKNKKNNRKSEFLFQDAEFASVLAELFAGRKYRAEELSEGWKLILKNQFHDILPGSSIEEVYNDSDADYASIALIGGEIYETALAAAAENVASDEEFIAFNPNTAAYSGPVFYGGRYYNVQNVAGKGFTGVALKDAPSRVFLQEKRMENDYYAVTFDEKYRLSRIYDKLRGREILKSGCAGNVLEAHEDYPPGYYDGWELRVYHDEKIWEIDDVAAAEFFDEGARRGVKITRRFMHSTIEQKICLYDNCPRIDFETFADWHDEHLCIKAYFPFDLNATKATYDIQFGNIERATTRNNSWEQAKFEVCAHKFADVSESDYGVALMNDSKYGYEILGSETRLTLLRCATYPNPNGDKGKHEFTYSLYAHEGDLRNSDVVAQAYALNNPVAVIGNRHKGKRLKDGFSFVTADCGDVVIDTVKKAESGRGIVLRAFESANKHKTARLTFGFAVKRIFETDLMEKDIAEIAVKDNAVSLCFKPFEIKTLRIET